MSVSLGDLVLNVKVNDAAATATLAKLVKGSADAVKEFGKIDTAMRLTGQIMGNTAEQSAKMWTTMRTEASKSVFTMNEASTAMLNFSRAGLKAEEACNALGPSMALAAGMGGDLDTVSQGLVATINAFGDTFESTSHYADVFAVACSNSALEINSLMSACSVAAPMFRSVGWSIEDLNLYMGLMADNGIEASVAANALKSGITSLNSPSNKAQTWLDKLNLSITESNGTFKDATTFLHELQTAFSGLSASEQNAAAAAIFGKNRMSAWLSLINSGSDRVDEFAGALENVEGAAQNLSDAMLDGIGGAINQLSSTWDVFKNTYAEALGSMVEDTIRDVTDLINWLNEHPIELIPYGPKEGQLPTINNQAYTSGWKTREFFKYYFGDEYQDYVNTSGKSTFNFPAIFKDFEASLYREGGINYETDPRFQAPKVLEEAGVGSGVKLPVSIELVGGPNLRRQMNEFRESGDWGAISIPVVLDEETYNTFKTTIEDVHKSVGDSFDSMRDSALNFDEPIQLVDHDLNEMKANAETNLAVVTEWGSQTGNIMSRLSSENQEYFGNFIQKYGPESLNMYKKLGAMSDQELNETIGLFSDASSSMSATLGTVQSAIENLILAIKGIPGYKEIIVETKFIETVISSGYGNKLDYTPDSSIVQINKLDRNAGRYTKRTGEEYVPYDGYVAELHKGERILTRAENEEYTRMKEQDGYAEGRMGDTIYNITIPNNDNALETARRIQELTRREYYGFI